MRMREAVNVGDLMTPLVINMNVERGPSNADIQGQNMT